VRVVELFAGGGGAAVGLHEAGLLALAHVEWDRDACSTLRAAVAAGFFDGDVIEGAANGAPTP
jgi:DNA (cytosine-5)-methyltransferase 1